MGITLANNAHTTLSADASSTDTVFYVEDIDSFPTLDFGDYFYCTIERTSGAQEIVKVTQINSSSFIVERGQENTIPISFPIGSLVELRMTVQNITDLIVTGENVDDEAYGVSWNGDADNAASRNAVYDKFEAVAGDIAAAVADALTTSDLGVTVQEWDNTLDQLSGQNITSSAGEVILGSAATSSGDYYWGIKIDNAAPAVGGFIWNLNGTDQWRLNMNYAGNMFLYNPVLASSVFTIDDATNVMAFSTTPTVQDDAYAAGWNGSLEVPTKNAIYDKVEGLGSLYQPLDADLTIWAGLTPSANAQSLVTAADYAAMKALLDLEIGTDVQAQSSNLSLLASEIMSTDSAGTLYLGKATGASNHYWGVKIDNTAPALGGFKWNLENVDKWRLSMNSSGVLFLYNETLAGSVYSISPSTNVMAFAVTPTVQDDAYAAGWNGSTEVPTKNAIYDKIESLSFGSGDLLAANNLSELTATASTARSNLGLAIGTDVQAYDADLASWAAVTRAAGFDTFVATPSSVNLKSLVTDETGSGSLVFATSPTLVTPALGVATATSIQGPPKISSETTGALTSTSRNCIVQCSGNITLPASGMSDGDSILIDPRGTARTITRPAAHTMYIANTDSATGTTGAHNVVTAVYHGSSKWTVQGSVS